MPNVNISWNRDAGDENYIYGMPGGTIGPNSGSRTVNVPFGQVYNLSSSGSGPGYTSLRRLNSQALGLDDRQGFANSTSYSTTPLYRYYNPTNGDHFSGISVSAPAGYVNEGILTNVFVGNQPPGTVNLVDAEGPGKPTSTYTAYVWPWNATSFNIGSTSVTPKLIYSLTNGYDTMWSTFSNEGSQLNPPYVFDPNAGNGSNGYAFYGSNQPITITVNQSAGGDGDFNDMIVYVNGGSFTGDSTYTGPAATYGCMDPNAVNYDPNANAPSLCVYANPNPQLTINGQTSTQTIVEGDTITVNWSAQDTNWMYTGVISGEGAPGTLSSSSWASGSFSAQPTSDTTYTYSVSYAPPTKYDSFSIPVDVKEIPEIIASFPNGSTINRGQNATLEWTTSGDATTMSISPGFGLQNLSGQLTVSPTETTTYTLYASAPGFDGRLQDSVSLTLTVLQPPSATLTIPSIIDWGDSSFQVLFEFENVLSYDLTVEYTDLDGVVITHPAFTGADPSQTTVNLLIGDESSSTIPKWNNRGYSSGKVKLKAYGAGSLFVEKESTFSINIDQMPDPVDIPSSEDKFLGEEPVITPDVTVTSDNIVINDVDIPVEITADSPIQVEIDAGGVWYNVRQT
tara:strand:+ start:5839 stop:7710 length:1872 start_codon:yes stop_codon:yes gene_type:complete